MMYPNEIALDYERIVQNFEEDLLRAGATMVRNQNNSDVDDVETVRIYREEIRSAFRAYRDATLVAQAQRGDGKD